MTIAAMLALFRAVPIGAWGMISAIAGMLGISPLRLVIYVACVISALSGLLVVRHHYVQLGYNEALQHVSKLDARAKKAAQEVQTNAAKCDKTSGYWDVITQNCRLGDDAK